MALAESEDRKNVPDGMQVPKEIALRQERLAVLDEAKRKLEARAKERDQAARAYCVRNYPGGIDALAKECRPLLAHASGARRFQHIAEKFDAFEGHGPTCVRRFVEDTRSLGERTPEQWQQDAFGQIDALLRAMALRR